MTACSIRVSKSFVQCLFKSMLHENRTYIMPALHSLLLSIYYAKYMYSTGKVDAFLAEGICLQLCVCVCMCVMLWEEQVIKYSNRLQSRTVCQQ